MSSAQSLPANVITQRLFIASLKLYVAPIERLLRYCVFNSESFNFSKSVETKFNPPKDLILSEEVVIFNLRECFHLNW